MAKQHDTPMLDELDKSIDAVPAGTIQAKGFSDPIPVYTVRGITESGED